MKTMKYLLEQWRKVMGEGEAEHFGPEFVKFREDVEKMLVEIPLDDEHEIIDVLFDLAQKHFKRLVSCGSFRCAFATPDDKYVIKIASPEESNYLSDACQMNIDEAHNPKQTKYSDILPRFGPVEKHGLWVVAEKVHVIKSIQQFRQFLPNLFMLATKLGENYIIILQGLFVMEKMPYNATTTDVAQYWIDVDNDNDNGLDLELEDVETLVDGIRDNLNKIEPAALRVVQLCAEFDLPVWDIREDNVGYVVRDDRKHLVFLDLTYLNIDDYRF